MNPVSLSSRKSSEGRPGEITYEPLTAALGSGSCVSWTCASLWNSRPATCRVRSTVRSPLLIPPNCQRTSLSFSCARRVVGRPRRSQKPSPWDELTWFTILAA